MEVVTIRSLKFHYFKPFVQLAVFRDLAIMRYQKNLKIKGYRERKKNFDYVSGDEPVQSPEGQLQVNFFSTMIDVISNSAESRFTSLKEHFKNFGFL